MSDDNLRAYVERDPDHVGSWRWWLTDSKSLGWDGAANLNLPRGNYLSRRAARRGARRALAHKRAHLDAKANPQREEIR